MSAQWCVFRVTWQIVSVCLTYRMSSNGICVYAVRQLSVSVSLSVSVFVDAVSVSISSIVSVKVSILTPGN